MRVKLCDKYKEERETICQKLIAILDLKDGNTFLLSDLDNDIAKQTAILDMKDEIQKCFAVSSISTFKPNDLPAHCTFLARSVTSYTSSNWLKTRYSPINEGFSIAKARHCIESHRGKNPRF